MDYDLVKVSYFGRCIPCHRRRVSLLLADPPLHVVFPLISLTISLFHLHVIV